MLEGILIGIVAGAVSVGSAWFAWPTKDVDAELKKATELETREKAPQSCQYAAYIARQQAASINGGNAMIAQNLIDSCERTLRYVDCEKISNGDESQKKECLASQNRR